MQPGGGMPLHTNTVEHGQYVLRGRATVHLGDRTLDVTAGDAVHIPAGVAHSYTADATEGFEFLCVVPQSPDHIRVIKDEG